VKWVGVGAWGLLSRCEGLAASSAWGLLILDQDATRSRGEKATNLRVSTQEDSMEPLMRVGCAAGQAAVEKKRGKPDPGGKS